MNFLIDTNICSAYIKGNPTVWSRFLQHAGGMALAVVTVGELWTWAKRAKTRPQARNAVAELIELLDVIEIDFQVALRFGELRAQLLDAGKPMPDMDMLIAATALVHDLTLVTHNTNDFQPVAGLSVVDWFNEQLVFVQSSCFVPRFDQVFDSAQLRNHWSGHEPLAPEVPLVDSSNGPPDGGVICHAPASATLSHAPDGTTGLALLDES